MALTPSYYPIQPEGTIYRRWRTRQFDWVRTGIGGHRIRVEVSRMPATTLSGSTDHGRRQWMSIRPPNGPLKRPSGAHRLKCLYNMYDKFIDNDGNAVQQSTGQRNIPARAGSWPAGASGGRQAAILERTALSRTRVTTIRFAYKVNAEMLLPVVE